MSSWAFSSWFLLHVLSRSSNTISNVKILLSDFHDRQRGFPVSAEIDRGRWFEYGQVGLNDIVQPPGVILLGSSFKSQDPNDFVKL